MQKPFKFRYANEMAGAFVLLAATLVVLGVFFAGRSQGWFEGRFTLRTSFDPGQGAYGLQEGNEVRVLDTLAGRVGSIMPTAGGRMSATFDIRERFRPYIGRLSVAKVKKKFGVAGDSYVEIENLKGAPVEDGDDIQCVRDEQVMETAQRVLSDLQDMLMPLLTDVKATMKNISALTASLDQGEGLVGQAIVNPALAEQVKETLANANDLMIRTEETMRETTRLVKGAQKIWLLRGHVEEDKEDEWISSRGIGDGDLAKAMAAHREALTQARAADKSADIAQSAYNLAAYMLAEGQNAPAAALLREAREEARKSGRSTAHIEYLEAEALREAGQPAAAMEKARKALAAAGRSDQEIKLQCHILMADLHMDAGRLQEAAAETRHVTSLAAKAESSQVRAQASGAMGRLRAMEKRPEEAAIAFDAEAGFLRTAGAFAAMAEALRAAGTAYEQADRYPEAADRYFRAGRSFLAGGTRLQAIECFKRALALSPRGQDEYFATQMVEFLKEMSAPGEAPAAGNETTPKAEKPKDEAGARAASSRTAPAGARGEPTR